RSSWAAAFLRGFTAGASSTSILSTSLTLLLSRSSSGRTSSFSISSWLIRALRVKLGLYTAQLSELNRGAIGFFLTRTRGRSKFVQTSGLFRQTPGGALLQSEHVVHQLLRGGNGRAPLHRGVDLDQLTMQFEDPGTDLLRIHAVEMQHPARVGRHILADMFVQPGPACGFGGLFPVAPHGGSQLALVPGYVFHQPA